MRVMVTICPAITVRAGPGEVIVVEVEPQPEGGEKLPNRANEAVLAWIGCSGKVSPRIPMMMRRDDRMIGLKSRRFASTRTSYDNRTFIRFP